MLSCCIRVRGAAQKALEQPEYRELGCRVLGPAAAPVARVNNRYRYRITITGPDHKKVRELVGHLARAAQKDKENRGVSVYADFDPQD